MPGPWTTVPAVLDAIARAVRKPADGLQAYWTGFATDAVTLAYDDLISCLGFRGFTVDLLDAWDFREIANRTQAVYRALQMAGTLSGLDEKAIEGLNMIPRLDAAPALVIGGNAVAPSTSAAVGGIVSGRVAATNARRHGFDGGRGLFL